MPEVNGTSKTSAKSTAIKKPESSTSSRTAHSSSTVKNVSNRKRSGRGSSSRSPPKRRPARQNRSPSGSHSSSSSSSASDSSGSSDTDSSRSSKVSPKKTVRSKDTKSSQQSKAPHRAPVTKSDFTAVSSTKSTENRAHRDHSKKSTTDGSKPCDSTRPETTSKEKSSVINTAATETNAPSVTHVGNLATGTNDSKAASQKTQSLSKAIGKTTKSGDVEVAKAPEQRNKSPVTLPQFTRVLVEKLTRNVTKAHVTEIFSVWGEIQSVDMPPDRLHPEFSRSYAYVNYENPKSAADAVNFMNGGQIDGETIRVTEVFPSRSSVPGRTETGPSPNDKSHYREKERDTNKRETDKTTESARGTKENAVVASHRPDGSTDRPRERERPSGMVERRRETRERDKERRERDRGEKPRDRSRERDRERYDRPRRTRRGSSGSPFASRSGPPPRQRSPVASSRYRRPSPPTSSRTEAASGRRARSRSPLAKSQAPVRSGADTKVSGSRQPRTAPTRSSSSSSSDSGTSSSSSSSHSASSSSSSSSSSRSRS